MTVSSVCPSKSPPPSDTVNVTGTPASRLLPSSTTTAMKGFGSALADGADLVVAGVDHDLPRRTLRCRSR